MRWLLAFHVVGVVMWLGSLMALSRVLGYHTREPPSVRPRFSFVEGRLDVGGAMPGALLTLLTGLGLLAMEPMGWFRAQGWLHTKLLLVLFLALIHGGVRIRYRRMARQRADQPTSRAFFGAAHGIVGLLLIGIIILAIVRPY